MLNKRVKNGIKKFHNSNVGIRLCFGTLALITVCLLLIVIATFSQIKISFNIPSNAITSYLEFEYIPQIPVILFIAALLGEGWGLFTVFLYIILGLTPWFPVFALGGGLSYIFQYNFGYIFGFIFAVFFTARELKKGQSIWHMLLATLYGVVSIHIIGTVYMVIIALLRHDTFGFITNWIYYQSLSKILYDIIIGFFVIVIAKAFRKILWMLVG